MGDNVQWAASGGHPSFLRHPLPGDIRLNNFCGSRVANRADGKSFGGARLAYEEEGVSMLMLLSDFVLFSFVVTLIAGLVLATASLLG
jgi:hypothetical protein